MTPSTHTSLDNGYFWGGADCGSDVVYQFCYARIAYHVYIKIILQINQKTKKHECIYWFGCSVVLGSGRATECVVKRRIISNV